MTYVLVHWDASDESWTLHEESDGTECGGPWESDPRKAGHRELYQAMDTESLVTGDYRFIRESSKTPLPW